MESTRNCPPPSGPTEIDAAARNLNLVVCAFVGGLACFLLYLVWRSFAEAAPTVLWPQSSASRDHKYAKGYEPDNPRVIVPTQTDLPWTSSSIVEQGQRLYRKAGCALCHGPEGQGGVTNPNYVNDVFPSLAGMASKLGLEFPEDVDVVVKMLAAGRSLDNPAEIDVPDGAGIISARYFTVTNVILNGNLAMKKDPNGPEPIVMPSYKDTLTKEQINQILASFLVLYPIKEEQWDEEGEQ